MNEDKAEVDGVALGSVNSTSKHINAVAARFADVVIMGAAKWYALESSALTLNKVMKEAPIAHLTLKGEKSKTPF